MDGRQSQIGKSEVESLCRKPRGGKERKEGRRGIFDWEGSRVSEIDNCATKEGTTTDYLPTIIAIATIALSTTRTRTAFKLRSLFHRPQIRDPLARPTLQHAILATRKPPFSFQVPTPLRSSVSASAAYAPCSLPHPLDQPVSGP